MILEETLCHKDVQWSKNDPKVIQNHKTYHKMMPNGYEKYQNVSQNEQGTPKKEPSGKASIFDGKKWCRSITKRSILGATSPRDWTSLLPDHTCGHCKNVCFYLGFNRIWANGSVCRDLFSCGQLLFSISKIHAKKT